MKLNSDYSVVGRIFLTTQPLTRYLTIQPIN